MQTGQGSIQEVPTRNQPPPTEGEIPVHQQDLGRRPQGRLDQAILELHQAPAYRRYMCGPTKAERSSLLGP